MRAHKNITEQNRTRDETKHHFIQLAWNNKIGFVAFFVGLCAMCVCVWLYVCGSMSVGVCMCGVGVCMCVFVVWRAVSVCKERWKGWGCVGEGREGERDV